TKQTDVVKLFSEQTLLDLSHLVNQEERADFVDLLLSYAYEVFFKRKRIALANSLKVLIIIEEVHALFQQQENIITSFFREVRKWGGGLVITDQNPSAIPRFIRGNTFYTMVLHLGSKEDIEIMSRAMMLNGDERHYLTMLHAGEGIGIMKMQSRFTKPFLVKIAPIE
ncbi:MAG: zonular occludens toxin domain-containing protein, partial [Nitrososphaerota archaeon]